MVSSRFVAVFASLGIASLAYGNGCSIASEGGRDADGGAFDAAPTDGGTLEDVSTTDARDSTFTVGGTVTGLAAEVVLQNNAGDDLTVRANGSFAFPTPLTSNSPYVVTVKTQPEFPKQECVLTNETGTIETEDVTSVQVACTTESFPIGGSVTGLLGSGLVLQNNAGDDLAITADGAFEFVAPVASGATFVVTVKDEPAGPHQTCLVSAASGTVRDAAIANVAVTCSTNTYRIGGAVTGLTAGSVVLENNGADAITVSGNESFSFPVEVASGDPYSVAVATHPPGLFCDVTSEEGTVAGAPIADVAVTCGPIWPAAGAVWQADGRVYGRFTWAQASTTNNGRGNATAACSAGGGTLARPNSQAAWDALHANLPQNSMGYWIDGHNDFVCGTATPGSPKSYQYGNMHSPTGTPLLYTGCNCNDGEQGLVAYRYAGVNTFDGCQGVGGMQTGYLGVMDEQLTYSYPDVVGFVCMR